MPTRVALTFDIEFDINGTLAFPEERKPRGLESLIGDDPSASVGLTRILEILQRYGIQGTFFVEALQSVWFGPEEMGEAVSRIRAHGHDIQLHLHPVWSLFQDPNWQTNAKMSPPRSATHDSLVNLPQSRVLKLLDLGLEIFSDWGLGRPRVIRTGSLFIDHSTYEAFAARGLNVSSSVGLALNKPSETALQLFHAPRQFHGVLELPVTSYIGADHLLRRKLRLATLIGMGLGEQRSLLKEASSSKLPFLIALSHASEFYHHSSKTGYKPNTLTELKLVQLCESIQGSESLESVTINELSTLIEPEAVTDQRDIALHISRFRSAARFTDALLA